MRRRTRHGSALIVVLLIAGAGAASTATAFADDGTGIPFTVTITEDSSTPTPTPGTSVSAGTVFATPAASESGGGRASDAVPGDSTTGAATPGTDEVAVSPVLFVGGIEAAAIPSLDPIDGTVDVWLTVRNAGATPIDTTASFALQGAVLHNHLDGVDAVAVAALQPGESRVVSARLHHAGQWTLLTASATIAPPAAQGSEAREVTRDALVVMLPWLVIVGLVVVVLLFVLIRVLRAVSAAASTRAVTA